MKERRKSNIFFLRVFQTFSHSSPQKLKIVKNIYFSLIQTIGRAKRKKKKKKIEYSLFAHTAHTISHQSLHIFRLEIKNSEKHPL